MSDPVDLYELEAHAKGMMGGYLEYLHPDKAADILRTVELVERACVELRAMRQLAEDVARLDCIASECHKTNPPSLCVVCRARKLFGA